MDLTRACIPGGVGGVALDEKADAVFEKEIIEFVEGNLLPVDLGFELELETIAGRAYLLIASGLFAGRFVVFFKFLQTGVGVGAADNNYGVGCDFTVLHCFGIDLSRFEMSQLGSADWIAGPTGGSVDGERGDAGFFGRAAGCVFVGSDLNFGARRESRGWFIGWSGFLLPLSQLLGEIGRRRGGEKFTNAGGDHVGKKLSYVGHLREGAKNAVDEITRHLREGAKNAVDEIARHPRGSIGHLGIDAGGTNEK